MPVTQAQLIARAEPWLQDQAGKLSRSVTGDLGRALSRAVEQYSHDRPRVLFGTLNGTGTAIDFAVPAAWSLGFSRLVRVEHPYPPATGVATRNVLLDESTPNNPELVRVIADSAGAPRITFFYAAPASGTANVLIAYTVPHTVHAATAASTTIVPSEVEAVAVLLASYGCEMLASRYAETNDATLSVDSVDWRSKSAEYASRARSLRADYDRQMGTGDAAAAASGYADWDIYMRGGFDRLFHRARTR